MKKIFFVITLCLCCVCLLSCQKAKQYELKEIGQDETLIQCNSALSQREIMALLTEKGVTDAFKELNITQFKALHDGHYTVVNASDGLCLINSDKDWQAATVRKITFSENDNESNVSSLREGMTLDDAQTADPDGQYDFWYTSWTEAPQISHHFFQDGKCFYIRFKEGIIVEIIQFSL